MARTNSFTAEAATVSQPNLNRPLMLIGIFEDPEGSRILLRTKEGAIETLSDAEPNGDLRLVGTGPGWAMVEENGTVHRLTIS